MAIELRRPRGKLGRPAPVGESGGDLTPSAGERDRDRDQRGPRQYCPEGAQENTHGGAKARDNREGPQRDNTVEGTN